MTIDPATLPPLTGLSLSKTVVRLAMNPQLIPYVKTIACNFEVLSEPGNQMSSWEATELACRRKGDWRYNLVTPELLDRLKRSITLITKPWHMNTAGVGGYEAWFLCDAMHRIYFYRYFTMNHNIAMRSWDLTELERFKDIAPHWEDGINPRTNRPITRVDIGLPKIK